MGVPCRWGSSSRIRLCLSAVLKHRDRQGIGGGGGGWDGGAWAKGGGWGDFGKSLTGVALVRVHFDLALGPLEVCFGDDGVEGVFAAAEDFAGGAVAVGRSQK